MSDHETMLDLTPVGPGRTVDDALTAQRMERAIQRATLARLSVMSDFDTDEQLVRYAINAAEIKQQDEAWEAFNRITTDLAEARGLLAKVAEYPGEVWYDLGRATTEAIRTFLAHTEGK